MIELLINFADKLFKSLSVRKIMYWLFITILLYVFTPHYMKSYFYIEDSFIPKNLLSFLICIVVSFIIIDAVSTIYSAFTQSKKDKKLEKEIRSLNSSEKQIVKKLIAGGLEPFPFKASDTTLSLLAKNILVCHKISFSLGVSSYMYGLSEMSLKKISEMIRQDQNLLN